MAIRLNLTLADLEGDALLNVADIAEARGISKEEALAEVLAEPFDDDDFSGVVDSRAIDILGEINAPIVRAACELYEHETGTPVDANPIFCTVTRAEVRIPFRGERELIFHRAPDGGLVFTEDRNWADHLARHLAQRQAEV